MKNQAIFTAFIFMLLLPLISTGNDKIIIKGKSADPFTRISYTFPSTDGYFEGFTQAVTLDHTGAFKIEVPMNQPSGFVTILVEGVQYSLVSEANQAYEFAIDISNTKNPITYTGPNKVGMDYYNSLKAHHLSANYNKAKASKNVRDIMDEILKDKDLEKANLQNQLSEGLISDHFYNTVIKDRDIYYAVVASNSIKSRFLLAHQAKADISSDIITLIDQIFETYSPLEPDYMLSKWWIHYIDLFLDIQQYRAAHFSMETLIAHRQNNTFHTNQINLAAEHLEGVPLKFYVASYLYRSSSNHKNEKELIKLASAYDREYPDNPYSPYFQDYITAIKDYYKTGDLNTSTYTLIEDANQINSLKEAVLLAGGKPVYLDVWATWCAPCIKEFAHKPEVNKLLKEYGYTPFYISIDDEKNELKWKEKIVEYKLEEGHHLRANHKLKSELMRLYGTSDSLIIPIYILFDGAGEIIEKNAARPSDINRLRMHLESNK